MQSNFVPNLSQSVKLMMHLLVCEECSGSICCDATIYYANKRDSHMKT